MRFSVDAHAIGQHLTGNETYVRNLLNCYADLDDDSDFIAYLSRRSAFESVPRRFEKSLVAENPFVRLGFDLPRKLRQDRPDLLHVQYTAPVGCSVPIVVSVHDISFLEHPEYFTRFRALQLRLTVRQTVRAAARVLTVSEFSKQGIIRAYGLEEDKVVVMPNAASSSFRPLPREGSRRWAHARFGFSFPFVLTVGDLQPRKNHLKLIRGFEDILRAEPKLPHHLVLVGKETWYSPTVRSAAAKSAVSSRIHFTNFVEDEELIKLYAACDLFVYPSLYEGFGLPILEAMAAGTPVLCSRLTSVPEVAGNAALYIDQFSLDEFAERLLALATDGDLRRRLIEAGRQRAQKFRWEETARRTAEVYAAVVAQPAPDALLRRRMIGALTSLDWGAPPRP